MSFEFEGITVDELVGGMGLSIRRSVAAASTENITLTTDVEAGDTLDGYTLVLGDRILLKDQTTTIDNGIYIVQTTGAPLRAEDLSNGFSAASVFTVVKNGSDNDDTVWLCTNDPGSDIVGTDGLNWIFFGGSGVASAGTLLTDSNLETIQGGRNWTFTRIFGTDYTIWDRVGERTVGGAPFEVQAQSNANYVVSYSGPGRTQNTNATGCEIGLFRSTPDNRKSIASVSATNPIVITTTASHGLSVNQNVDILSNADVPAGVYTVTSVPTATTFEVAFNNTGGTGAAGGIVRYAPTPFEVTALSVASPCVVTTALDHNIQIGDTTEIIDNDEIPNGTYAVSDVPASNQVEIVYDNSGGATSATGFIQTNEVIDITYFWTRMNNRSHGFSLTNTQVVNTGDYLYPRIRMIKSGGGQPQITLYGNFLICFTTA